MAARDRFFGKIVVLVFLFFLSVFDAQGASRRIAREHYKKIIAMRYSSLVARKVLPKKPDLSRPRVTHVPRRDYSDIIVHLTRFVAEQGGRDIVRVVVEHIPHIATTLVAIGVLNKNSVSDAARNKEHERYKKSLNSEQREAYSIVEATYNAGLESCDFPQDFGDFTSAEARAKFLARAVQQHNTDLGYDASYMPYNAPKVIYRGKEYTVATKTYDEWCKEEDRKYISPSVEPKPLPRKNKGCGGNVGGSPTAVPIPVASPESPNKGCGGTVNKTPPILPNPATNPADQPAKGCGGEVEQGSTADYAAVVKAPGVPDANSGFYPPKRWDGKSKAKHIPKTGKGEVRRGYEDENGSIWIPTGPTGHGGPHWDVQHTDGSYDNVTYGGNTRGGRMGTTKGGMLQPGRLKCDALPVEGEAEACVAPARHGVAQAAQNSANNGPAAEVNPALATEAKAPEKKSRMASVKNFFKRKAEAKEASAEKMTKPAADVQKDQKPKDAKQSQAEAVPVVANPARKQRERRSILRFFKRNPEDKETDEEKESVDKKDTKTAPDLGRRSSAATHAPVVAPTQTPSPSAAPKKPRRTSILQSMKEPEKKETSTQEKAKVTSPVPAAEAPTPKTASPAPERKSILKSAKDFFTRKKESSQEQPAKDKAGVVADSSAGNAKAQAPASKESKPIIKLSPAMQSKLEQLARDKAAEHLRKKQEEEDAAARKRQEAQFVELKRRQALFRSAVAADAQHSAAEAQKAQEPKNAKKQQQDDGQKRSGANPNSAAQAPAAAAPSAAPDKTSMLLQGVKDFIKENGEKTDNNKETKEQKEPKDKKDAQPKEAVKGEDKESIQEMLNKAALEKEAIMARERAYAQQQEAQAYREHNRQVHDRAMAAMREQTAAKRDLQLERELQAEARREQFNRECGLPYIPRHIGPCDKQCREDRFRKRFG